MKFENFLREKISVYSVEVNKLISDSINIEEQSYRSAIQKLMLVGNIIEENEVENCIVLSIREGALKLNTAFVALKIDREKIYMIGYAKEGLIKQNTCKKAFRVIKEALEK